ncbi:MAG: hypothetical protein JRJ85_04615 [Deltaproteobacteria bacterium]|nr:hypothetical protein [Deltaproteobacteria bacterium]
MANLDFYRSKVAELKLRLQWIKDSVNGKNNGHNEIERWIHEQVNEFEAKIALMELIVQRGNAAYLPRLRTDNILLERGLLCVSNYVGLFLREGEYEREFSSVIQRLYDESGLPLTDFLIAFTTILNGPGVSVGNPSLPIFYVRDESLVSAYSWLGLFHEMGHTAVRHDRTRIIEPLVQIVREHHNRERAAIGPVDPQTRKKLEDALNESEKYWTEGYNDIRLEELFCDCFAVYCCGLAYLYSWLDFGVGFEDRPKFINLCDEHPPFSARFEACWYVLSEELKTSDHGKRLSEIWDDYNRSYSGESNPDMEYGTACHERLIKKLAEKSHDLIRAHWPSLPLYKEQPDDSLQKDMGNQSLAADLNSLIAVLFFHPQEYPLFEEKLKKEIMN